MAPITFQKYLATITVKMGEYAGYQLFHAISHDNNPNTVHFMYFPDHNVEANQVLNVLPCILSKRILVNPNDLITRSGIEQATMGI